MKEIKLSCGQVALVDDEDFDFLNQWKWYATKTIKGDYYARRWVGGEEKHVFMHRIILGLNKGDKMTGDHKDHNTLNNQRYNLRKCTYSQNAANRVKRSNETSSKYIGVIKFNGRFRAAINYRGYCIYIGMFDKEEDAALAFNKKKVELFGEYASTNYIEAHPKEAKEKGWSESRLAKTEPHKI